MRFDDLIVRAAGQEWVPLGYRTSATREAWFWVTSEDHAAYIEHSGAIAGPVSWDDEQMHRADAARAEPPSRLCLYRLDRKIQSGHRRHRTGDVGDDGSSMPLVAFTVDRWPVTGAMAPPRKPAAVTRLVAPLREVVAVPSSVVLPREVVAVPDPIVPDAGPVQMCCGRVVGSVEGQPIRNVCRLCPESSTYWRNEPGFQARASVAAE